jgi:murein DD-endopeptidase MepM/ murein hydrolase activator NlpD
VPSLPILGVVPPTRGILSYLYKRSDDHAHRGIDLPAPKGTPVRAARTGVVEQASSVWKQGFSGYGKHVVVRHPNDVRTLYAHLDSVVVKPGQAVQEGERIGAVGFTAFTQVGGYTDNIKSGGAHLHFEVAPRPYPMPSEASRIDPVSWLTGGGFKLGMLAMLAALGWGAARALRVRRSAP